MAIWTDISKNGHTSNDLCGNLINVMGNNIFEIDKDNITIDCSFIVLTNYTETSYEKIYGKKYVTDEQNVYSKNISTINDINDIIRPKCDISFVNIRNEHILYFDKEYLTLKQNHLNYAQVRCDISEIPYSVESEQMFNLTIDQSGSYIENICLPYKYNDNYSYSSTMDGSSIEFSNKIYDRFNNCILIKSSHKTNISNENAEKWGGSDNVKSLNNICLCELNKQIVLTERKNYKLNDISQNHPIGFNQNVCIEPSDNIIDITVGYNKHTYEYIFKDENTNEIFMDNNHYDCFRLMYNKTYRFKCDDISGVDISNSFQICYIENNITKKTPFIYNYIGDQTVTDDYSITVKFNYNVSDIYYLNAQFPSAKKNIHMLKRDILGDKIYYYYGDITIKSIFLGSNIYCYYNDKSTSKIYSSYYNVHDSLPELNIGEHTHDEISTIEPPRNITKKHHYVYPSMWEKNMSFNTNIIPDILYGHSSIIYDNTMIVCGGQWKYGDEEFYNNDIYSYNFNTNKWSTLTQQGYPRPQDYYGHTSIYWKNNNADIPLHYMVVCGGEEDSNQIYSFNIDDSTWNVIYNGGNMDKLRYHTANIYYSSSKKSYEMIIYGGLVVNSIDDEINKKMYKYDFIYETLTIMINTGSIPINGLYKHTSTILDNSIIVIGGKVGLNDSNNDYNTNIYIYEINTTEFSEENTVNWIYKSGGYKYICSHNALNINNDIIIMGGVYGDKYIETVDIYNVSSNTWGDGVKMIIKNRKRKNFTMNNYNNNIVIFGGYTGNDNTSNTNVYTFTKIQTYYLITWDHPKYVKTNITYDITYDISYNNKTINVKYNQLSIALDNDDDVVMVRSNINNRFSDWVQSFPTTTINNLLVKDSFQNNSYYIINTYLNYNLEKNQYYQCSLQIKINKKTDYLNILLAITMTNGLITSLVEQNFSVESGKYLILTMYFKTPNTLMTSSNNVFLKFSNLPNDCILNVNNVSLEKTGNMILLFGVLYGPFVPGSNIVNTNPIGGQHTYLVRYFDSKYYWEESPLPMLSDNILFFKGKPNNSYIYNRVEDILLDQMLIGKTYNFEFELKTDQVVNELYVHLYTYTGVRWESVSLIKETFINHQYKKDSWIHYNLVFKVPIDFISVNAEYNKNINLDFGNSLAGVEVHFKNMKITDPYYYRYNKETILDFSNKSIDSILNYNIINILDNHDTLEELNLAHNQISDVSELVKVLETNTALKKLYLNDNQISDISGLGKALKDNTTLEILDLCYNQITTGTWELSEYLIYDLRDNLTFNLDPNNKAIYDLYVDIKNNTLTNYLYYVDKGITDITELLGALNTKQSTVTNLYLNHNEISNVTEQDISSLLHVNVLRLDYNNISDITGLGNGLKGNETLTDLRILYNGINDVSALVEGLKENTTIKYMELRDGNYISGDGMAAIKIYLTRNLGWGTCDLTRNPGDNGIVGFDLIGIALKYSPIVIHIDLTLNTDISINKLGNLLKDNNTLKVLTLNSCQISDISALGNGLETNTTLEELNLAYNEISDVSALGKALETNTTLKTLYLHYNQISDISGLGKALETNTTLEILYLTSNKISDVSALAKALETNTTLEELWLGYNQIGDDGALLMGNALETNTTLKALYLWDNDITIITAICDALKTNETLNKLSLSSNQLKDEEGSKMAVALKINGYINYLNINNNDFTDTVKEEIRLAYFRDDVERYSFWV